MSEPFRVDPMLYRKLALEHEEVEQGTRKWAEPPTEWLNNFQASYGTIAEPVRQALHRFFDTRQQVGNQLADAHGLTARRLREAATAYENADHDTAQALANAGRDTEANNIGSPAGRGIPGNAETGTAGTRDAVPVGDGSMAHPLTPGFSPQSTSEPAASAVGAAPAGAAPTTAPAGTPGTSAPVGGAIPPLSSSGASANDNQPPDASRQVIANRETGMQPPLLTPFMAAVGQARDKAAEPAHVLGEKVDEDLVLARTLLRALLAAVGTSAVGVSWAVAVIRGPGGTGIFLTSNEGRGWLPPSIYLPRIVSTPWSASELLWRGTEYTSAPWEGVADPARVLVEFALQWGPKVGARLTAIASSEPIDPALGATLPTVSTAGNLEPSAEVDLRVLTADTTDRLGLAGSISALEHVASVPDTQVRQECLRLATHAHTRWGSPKIGSGDVVHARRARARIIDLLSSNQHVPDALWGELRDRDAMLAAAVMSRRTDLSQVPIGELRVPDDETLQCLHIERRCNELILLLGAEPSRQGLRDVVFAHEQALTHPMFDSLAVTVQPKTETAQHIPAAPAVRDHRTITAPETPNPPSGTTA